MLLDMEKFCAESGSVLHEVVHGADVECIVIVFCISLPKIDYHVFV